MYTLDQHVATPPPAPVDSRADDLAVLNQMLVTLVLVKGRGKVRPTAEDTVEVHYSGWTTDGKLFDSSY